MLGSAALDGPSRATGHQSLSSPARSTRTICVRCSGPTNRSVESASTDAILIFLRERARQVRTRRAADSAHARGWAPLSARAARPASSAAATIAPAAGQLHASGDLRRQVSGPAGPSTCSATGVVTARSPGAGASGTRRSMPRTADTSIGRHAGQPVDRAPQLAALTDHPLTLVLLHRRGRIRVDARRGPRPFELRMILACVYCAIMCPLSSPDHAARKRAAVACGRCPESGRCGVR